MLYCHSELAGQFVFKRKKEKYEKEELLLKVGVTTANNLVLFFSTETLNQHSSLVTNGWASKYQKIASAFSVKGTLAILWNNETPTDTKAKEVFKNK